jgi:hypothetical protein
MPSDTTLNVLWLDNKLDSLVINIKVIKKIRESERAAIAYVALHDSRDCDWDGEPNANHTNLSCSIITALGLGYQCSDSHIQLLKHWFRDDSTILQEVKYCPMTPSTSHQIHGIDKVILTRMRNNYFGIVYEASGANIRSESSWSFSESIVFKTEGDKLTIVSRKRSNIRKE